MTGDQQAAKWDHDRDYRKHDTEQRSVDRETALINYYDAERRAGADPLIAHERMAEFAKRLDAYEQERLSNERRS